MKIGAGGLHIQSVQDLVAARQADLTRIKPPTEEEIQKGKQRQGPELNKPVVDMSKSAGLNSYLRSKEAEDSHKRGRVTEEDEEGNTRAGLPKTPRNDRYQSGRKGALLDEYK